MSFEQYLTLDAQCVTPDAGHYFFGYYDKSPWDRSGRWLLAGRAEFDDRAPELGDQLELGLIDCENSYAFTPLAVTQAWNWQQGCMLQWLDDRRIIFNSRRGDLFTAVICDIQTGDRWELPRPIYTISTEQHLATSLNFARLHRLRPGYGYAGAADVTSNSDAPADDGLWMMDLRTGDAELICSIAELRGRLPDDALASGPHWLNHAQFTPDGERLAVLHRWDVGDGWRTRMLTMNRDGSDVYPLVDAGMCSHYDWQDSQHLLAFARVVDDRTTFDGFFRFRDRSHEAMQLAPEELTTDGHCSYSPNRQWILNDTYPDSVDQHRTLMLVRAADNAVFKIGRFYSPMPDDPAIRCDLHPRWRPDGRAVCIDSIHEGRRAMYTIDVGELIDAN